MASKKTVEHKAIMVGSGGVGKSSLTVQLMQNKFVSEYDPTVVESYTKHFKVGGENVATNLIDSAGQEEYRALVNTLMTEGEGFMMVYSVTSMDSFHEMEELIEQVKMAQDKDNVPMVLVGNKSDCPTAREVSKADGQKLADQLGCAFLETSAKTRENVDEAFAALAEAIARAHKAELDEAGKKKGDGPCVIA